MARRGLELRDHILWTAKNLFIESGFERTSMDMVAAAAETSKRSLYAYFETKDVLFLAVVELVHDLYLDNIKTPEHYADDPAEAIARYCGRFLQLVSWESIVGTCRLGVAEATRHPAASARYHQTFVETTLQRLAAFIEQRYYQDAAAAAELAQTLISSIVYPRFVRALFGVDKPRADLPDEAALATDPELAPIRQAVAELLPLRA